MHNTVTYHHDFFSLKLWGAKDEDLVDLPESHTHSRDSLLLVLNSEHYPF